MGDAPLRLLLVEDESSYAWILQADIARYSTVQVEVHHVTTLEEALAALETDPTDGVVLDLMLPDSRGLDTFLDLHRAHPEIPVVIMTGMQDEGLALTAMESGAQDYLYKGNLSGQSLVQSLRWGIARERSRAQALERSTNAGAVSRPAARDDEPFGRLRDSDPRKFAELVGRYAELLEIAVDRWVYKSEQGLDFELRALTQELSALNAGPRDITDMHTAALGLKAPASVGARSKALVDQGRLFALQLMGYLAAHYRDELLRHRREQ